MVNKLTMSVVDRLTLVWSNQRLSNWNMLHLYYAYITKE